MYQIFFYMDLDGRQPVLDYMCRLAGKGGKDSRIKLNKIQDYIQILKVYGTYAGEPYVKHIASDIWELRPLKIRIFFTVLDDRTFVLLHSFEKKTPKTPRREIDKAVKELENIRKRGVSYEE